MYIHTHTHRINNTYIFLIYIHTAHIHHIHQFTFSGEGDEYSPGIARDIVFTLREKPHEFLQRDGDNLIMRLRVSLVKALTGWKVRMYVCVSHCCSQGGVHVVVKVCML